MTLALTMRSTLSICSAVNPSKCVKSKRSRSGATSEPACGVLAEHEPQRPVQQVRRGVVSADPLAAHDVDGGVTCLRQRARLLTARRRARRRRPPRILRVLDRSPRPLVVERSPGVADLAALLAVERRAVEHDLAAAALLSALDRCRSLTMPSTVASVSSRS
jgi:hypothetical protein